MLSLSRRPKRLRVMDVKADNISVKDGICITDCLTRHVIFKSENLSCIPPDGRGNVTVGQLSRFQHGRRAVLSSASYSQAVIWSSASLSLSWGTAGDMYSRDGVCKACPFCRGREHGSFVVQNACVRRYIPWQLPCLESRQNLIPCSFCPIEVRATSLVIKSSAWKSRLIFLSHSGKSKSEHHHRDYEATCPNAPCDRLRAQLLCVIIDCVLPSSDDWTFDMPHNNWSVCPLFQLLRLTEDILEQLLHDDAEQYGQSVGRIYQAKVSGAGET